MADIYNNAIRKITPAGVVTTLAGSVKGYADGSGAAAQFSSPYGVVTDASGNVYVADRDNNTIRKITSAGVVNTLPGFTYGFADGIGSEAQFSSPYGVAVDLNGNMYVADRENNKIRKITSAGVTTTLAGSTPGYADGEGSAAKFSVPCGVATDATGNVYVADTRNHKIRKITPSGVVTTLAGSVRGSADGLGIAAQFNQPVALATDTSGNLYVIEAGNLIRKITPDGFVTTLTYSVPLAIGIAIDMNDNIYVTCSDPLIVRKITTDGIVSTLASGSDQLGTPRGISIGTDGNVYLTDVRNNVIRKITPAGGVTIFAGSVKGSVDGIGTDAQFNFPNGLTTDVNGNIYVADTYNNTIRKITAQSLGLNNISENKSFKAYPNPFRDLLKIQSYDQDAFSYKLFDMTGKQVLSGDCNDSAKSGINTSALPKGVYFLSLMADGKTENIKVIKE